SGWETVVFDHGCDSSIGTGQKDADTLRIRVLDGGRQCVLDEPVERRLDVLGQTLVRESRLELDRDARLLGGGRGQASESRLEPEVVERLGSQLDGESANVLQGGDDELARACERGAAGLRIGCALG